MQRQQEIEETLWEVLAGVQIRWREIHVLRHGCSVCNARHLFVSLRHRDIMAGSEYGVKYVERPRRYRAPALSHRDKEVRAHREANGDHEGSHLLGIGFLRVTRAEPSA